MPIPDPNVLTQCLAPVLERPSGIITVTTLYYVFSTIPQTLAGAIAFLGAFVLFRVQAQNRAIEEKCKEMFEGTDINPLWHSDVQDAYTRSDWVAFYAAVKGLKWGDLFDNDNPRGYAIREEAWNRLKINLDHNLNAKKQLAKSFNLSLILTSFGILVPIILLMVAEKISHNTTMSIIFTLGVICLTIASLVTYIRIIKRALADK